ncbi:periodic tryptophan protein 1 homolog [Nephila pilipes]|uniref:Periodic tryptophan protein 1 homolog n=1 Tax=Nephila pilipes TaxID=299642 RepID=A0A8X6NJQ3_NEPPI|nr:periodic tryptophan protein 1 homolog [Nephila pilipes]
MNFVPCVAWVPKGVAKSCPDKVQLSPEELKNLIRETKEMTGVENDFEDDLEEEPQSASEDENDSSSNTKDDTNETKDEEDFEARYNLDTYDDEDDNKSFLNIADVAVYVDNKDDKYITEHDEDDDDEEEEKDFLIKDNDNLLVVGHVEESSSVMEVYVYNKDDDVLYVHHDIVLPSYPLALEWLDFHPSEESPGNYVAVGDMSPVIQIWDLDIVDVLEPEYCLGEKSKKKKTNRKSKLKGHKDAVISLSWNKHLRNILASGSADSSIILWDLQDGTSLKKLNFHSGKVQALQWHPFECQFLLSGCTDGLISVYDCQANNEESKTWKVDGEIERVLWNLFDSLKFFCSTDLGFIHSINMKNTEIEHSIKAHNEGVTGLDMSQECNNILITTSMDGTLKVWNIENEFTLLKSLKLKVGSIYTARFSPDSGLTIAIGGNNTSNHLKVMDIAEKLNDDKSNIDEKASEPSKFKKIKQGTRVNEINTQPTFSRSPPKKKVKVAKKFNN